jgi:hypothetical protein
VDVSNVQLQSTNMGYPYGSPYVGVRSVYQLQSTGTIKPLGGITYLLEGGPRDGAVVVAQGTRLQIPGVDAYGYYCVIGHYRLTRDVAIARTPGGTWGNVYKGYWIHAGADQ